LIKSGLSVKYITGITSAFSDAVVRRLIELALIDFGEPPVAFSFICLGSEGRQEETLFTDQDNAIIYEDITEGDAKAVNDFFMRLGSRVCDSLNFIGYSWCEGNIMAKNPKWCKPLTTWETYFTDWIRTPEPQNLLDATIFFDFRSIFGEQSLTETLRSSVSSLIVNNPLFLYHLAYNTFNTKTPHISSSSILSEKNADMIDLKGAVCIITMFVRAYSLQSNIVCQNTLERIASVKERNIFSEKFAEEIAFSFNFLMTHRFRNQAYLIDKNLPLSNLLNTRRIIDTELYLLKKVLSSLPDIQTRIKTDFRIIT
jgi:CBS domain-containing protein